MDSNDLQKKIQEDEDFIVSKKYDNSLAKMVANISDDGAEDSQIAKVLLLTEEQVGELYEESVKTLREELTKDSD